MAEGETVIAAVVAPVLHEYEVAPLAVNVVEAPEQIVLVPVIETLIALGWVIVTLVELVFPQEFVTLTLYVPGARPLIEAVVAPVLHE